MLGTIQQGVLSPPENSLEEPGQKDKDKVMSCSSKTKRCVPPVCMGGGTQQHARGSPYDCSVGS